MQTEEEEIASSTTSTLAKLSMDLEDFGGNTCLAVKIISSLSDGYLYRFVFILSSIAVRWRWWRYFRDSCMTKALEILRCGSTEKHPRSVTTYT
jgi:hypothetical protein